jgi:hypothetical protein
MLQTMCVGTQGRRAVPFVLCRKYSICGHRNWYCHWESAAIVWQGHCDATNITRHKMAQPEKAQNGWAGEEVTLPWNVALCRVTLVIITAELYWLTEAVWNKQVEFTWFYAGYAFSSSFVCDYVCRDHRGNKGNMTGRCLVYWCAVSPPVFSTLLCCLELLDYVWTVGLW